jgi:hypothetical protein
MINGGFDEVLMKKYFFKNFFQSAGKTKIPRRFQRSAPRIRRHAPQ